jgi:methylase of polypeptide subunit release factors
LDIEQIGHVYEGLLDHIAVRVDADTLGLLGTKDKEPELSLDELDRERRHGKDKLIEFLKERTGRSTSALRNDVEAELDEVAEQRLLVACGNDNALVKHIAPYHALIRKDVWGYPQIYRAGSFMVTGGAERRQTGTHYTPKSLTEQIVTETLEPLVYVGPAEGKPRDAWKLRSAAELLDLKICDMAMGSGAFLVQVCRWLAERVVEAWEEAERQGAAISADGEVLEKAAGHDLLPPDREERLSFARRLVAERCVYGVDINPMAVELAKLSLWLVTLAKGRPFGFLDHNLRCGDSILGIHRLEQLTELSMTPNGKGQRRLFGQNIEKAVHDAIDLRRQLREMPIRDIHDVEAMARLDADARQRLEIPEHIADAFLGEVLASGGNENALGNAVASLTIQAERAIAGNRDSIATILRRADEALNVDLPSGKPGRHPLHWPLEFPEVFLRQRPGFDALVGNLRLPLKTGVLNPC